MASTTRLRDRIFAGFGAALFLGSAVAVSAYYVATSHDSTPATSATAQTTCDIKTPVPASTETAPAVYKPAGTVTALQTTDLEAGDGTAAKNGDCLVMKYQGNLATDGTVFDQNFDKSTALQFVLGSSDPQQQVIQGWEQGLVGMKVGGTRRLEIPSALGYGAGGMGSTIPPNADLVFTVKLEKIKKD